MLYEVTDPLGHLVERTAYDSAGRAWRQSAELGTVVTLGFATADTTVFTDALGYVHTDYYNPRGALASQVGPGNNTVARSYDDNFNLTALVDQNGNATYMDWGACGCNVERITDTLGNATHMTYDDANHPTSLTDARGNTTLYAYDGNLLVTTTDALSGTVVNTYNDGNLLIRTVARGITTTYSYRCNGLSSPRNCAILSCSGNRAPGA